MLRSVVLSLVPSLAPVVAGSNINGVVLLQLNADAVKPVELRSTKGAQDVAEDTAVDEPHHKHHHHKKSSKHSKRSEEKKEADDSSELSFDNTHPRKSAAYEKLNGQIDELKTRLLEKKSELRKASKEKKAEYKHVLDEQQENTTHLHHNATKLSKEVSELIEKNTKLRKKAERRMKKGNELRAELSLLQANITTAQEFIAESLSLDENTTEQTAVLRRLEALDAEQNAYAKRQLGMAAIDQASLLQVEAPNEDDPFNYVQTLAANFQQLDVDQEAKLEAMKAEFDEGVRMEEEKQASLLEMIANFTGEIDTQTALHKRLEVANAKLEETNNYLERRVGGLQAYAVQLSTDQVASASEKTEGTHKTHHHKHHGKHHHHKRSSSSNESK